MSVRESGRPRRLRSLTTKIEEGGGADGKQDLGERVDEGARVEEFAAATGTLTHASLYSLHAKSFLSGSRALSTGSAYALEPAVNTTTSKSEAAFRKKVARCGLRAKAVLVGARSPPGPAHASLPRARGAPAGRAAERTSVWSRSRTSVALPRWRGSGGGSRGVEAAAEAEQGASSSPSWLK